MHCTSLGHWCVSIGCFLLVTGFFDMLFGIPQRTPGQQTLTGCGCLLVAAVLPGLRRSWTAVGSWVRRFRFRRHASAIWPPRLIP
jgi:hypothetical protein